MPDGLLMAPGNFPDSMVSAFVDFLISLWIRKTGQQLLHTLLLADGIIQPYDLLKNSK